MLVNNCLNCSTLASSSYENSRRGPSYPKMLYLPSEYFSPPYTLCLLRPVCGYSYESVVGWSYIDLRLRDTFGIVCYPHSLQSSLILVGFGVFHSLIPAIAISALLIRTIGILFLLALILSSLHCIDRLCPTIFFRFLELESPTLTTFPLCLNICAYLLSGLKFPCASRATFSITVVRLHYLQTNISDLLRWCCEP